MQCVRLKRTDRAALLHWVWKLSKKQKQLLLTLIIRVASRNRVCERYQSFSSLKNTAKKMLIFSHIFT